MVPVQYREYYDPPEPLFGFDVEAQFVEGVNADIADAGRCIALEQWTAAVFHLMRVLEHGLRQFAQLVEASFPTSIELENWKNIIDVIEKQIRAIEQQPKSAQTSATLQFYSNAANHFWYFKEASRNHVAHSRATYDEREALRVYNAVKDFMEQLAIHKGYRLAKLDS